MVLRQKHVDTSLHTVPSANPKVPLTQRGLLSMLPEATTDEPDTGANDMGDKQVVVAIFPDEAAADAAAQSLKDWDELDEDVKLNSIGILALDEDGKIKTHKIGRRSWGKGAGIGVVLAALTPPGLLAGALAGGVLGGLHHKGLGVDSAERDEIADALSNGQSAVGALVAATEASIVSDKLAELGGELRVLSPTDEAVAEVDAVAPQVEALQ